jgi:microcystin-dependent protein
MNRRVTFTNLDNAHDVGPIGSDKGQLFVKDGKLFAQLQGKNAVELADLDGEATGSPIGTIITFGGSTAPSGWLACDGSSYSRTTYADLFGVISTTYGAPTGTTFLVPDLRGRAPLGAGTGSGLTARSLGTLGGYEGVTLAATEIPSHSHSVSESAHNHGVNESAHDHGTSESSHSHSFNDGGHDHGGIPSSISTYTTGVNSDGSLPVLDSADIGNTNGTTSSATASGDTGSSTTGLSVNDATTGISVQSATTGISVQNTGGGGSHSNMSPWVALTYLIKA